ncbi:hypothetical protein BCR43DRAFT_110584 [Syncephalastrum racemosum]|uniref:Uncharacterized protein n=1 Tax=Syncephalastrum racemosum TaxID=13706 RepID=A0A1X2GZX4_SYNRA|nr:hypothetical protein BCR43DRAFT_110584 [Syncephalastrum racemosum]
MCVGESCASGTVMCYTGYASWVKLCCRLVFFLGLFPLQLGSLSFLFLWRPSLMPCPHKRVQSTQYPKTRMRRAVSSCLNRPWQTRLSRSGRLRPSVQPAKLIQTNRLLHPCLPSIKVNKWINYPWIE